MDDSVEMKRMLETAMKAHPETFANFDTTKNVQDQLQEMVGDYEACIDIIGWHNETLLPDIGSFEPNSMEQLWLAFVMKEKYNKTWNGEEWVS